MRAYGNTACSGPDLTHDLKFKGISQAEVDEYGSLENVCKEWCRSDGFGTKPVHITDSCQCVTFYPPESQFGTECYAGHDANEPCLGVCYMRTTTDVIGQIGMANIGVIAYTLTEPPASDHTMCTGLCIAPAGYRVNAAGNNVELCPVNHYQTGDASNCTK